MSYNGGGMAGGGAGNFNQPGLTAAHGDGNGSGVTPFEQSAQGHYLAQMNNRQEYAEPAIWPQSAVPGTPNMLGWDPQGTGVGQAVPPERLGLEQPLPYPRKIAVPSESKDYLKALQATREAAKANAGSGVVVMDNLKDQEVAAVQNAAKAADWADFHTYISQLVDPRSPSDMAWLRSIYPGYEQQAIEQQAADLSFAAKSRLIDMFGIRSYDELVFQFMRDQGKINGPQLGPPPFNATDAYRPGFFAKMMWPQGVRAGREALKKPFATAQLGRKPAVPDFPLAGNTGTFPQNDPDTRYEYMPAAFAKEVLSPPT